MGHRQFRSLLVCSELNVPTVGSGNEREDLRLNDPLDMSRAESGIVAGVSDPVDDVIVEFDLPSLLSETSEYALELHPGELSKRIRSQRVEVDRRSQASLQLWWQRIAGRGVLATGIEFTCLSVAG